MKLATVLCGDNVEMMRTLPADSVDCVATSPSYWGLRRYLKDEWLGGNPNCQHSLGGRGGSGPRSKHSAMRPDSAHRGASDSCVHCGAVLAESAEIGRERVHDCLGWATGKPCGECFTCHLVGVFAEVWRVLKPTGVCWVNLADSYAANRSYQVDGTKQVDDSQPDAGARVPVGLKPGDLCGVPVRFALAMQAAGWYWRDTCIWAKAQEGEDAGGSAMPGSQNGWRWERHRVKVAGGDRAKNQARDGDLTRQGPGVSSRAQREPYFENGAGATEWRDCPGCPVCSPNDGYVLRKGSWRHTTAFEYVFMFTKSDDYACDKMGAVESPAQLGRVQTRQGIPVDDGGAGNCADQFADRDRVWSNGSGRNPRNVWNLSARRVQLRSDISEDEKKMVLSRLVDAGLI